LIAPRRTVLRPIGSFNTARLVVRASHVEQWLHGVLVVVYTLQSPALAALVAQSTLQALPGFGQAVWGDSVLQHHGDPVWFRHLCLRPLPDEQAGGLPWGRRDQGRHTAAARRRPERSRARGRPSHDTHDRCALRARTP
jgi:3-keto-disaccharide hydrolase